MISSKALLPAAAVRHIVARQRVKRWLADHERVLLPAASFLLVGVTWEVAATVGLLNRVFFPSPTSIIAAGAHTVRTSLFWTDLWTSTKEFLAGYTIALAVGLPFGFALGWFTRVGHFCRPWVDALNATPSIALVPLVLIWFGLGFSSKVAIVFLATVVTVIVNVYSGATSVDQRYLRVAESFSAHRLGLLRSVAVPSVAPFAFAAARLAVGRAVSGVVIGEYFGAQSGLAYRLFQDANVVQTTNVFFGATVITFLAFGAFRLVNLAEKRLLGWRGVLTRW